MDVIANTTIISNFASIGRIELLGQLYTTLHISVEVLGEIHAGLNEGYDFYSGIDRLLFPINHSGWIHLTSLNGAGELRSFSETPPHLHAGEASSIAIAYHRKWYFLSDDLAARKYARRLGIRISGTVGTLVLCVERALCTLDEANKMLQQMIRNGYRSPVSDLSLLVHTL